MSMVKYKVKVTQEKILKLTWPYNQSPWSDFFLMTANGFDFVKNVFTSKLHETCPKGINLQTNWWMSI